MSQTIYARVPDQVKEATEAHAAARGLTLASAVADLLDRGLQATADEASIEALQQRAAALEIEVVELRNRDEMMSSAYTALAERTAQRVGACPNCNQGITGYDLLVKGSCRHCSTSLAQLMGPTATPPSPGAGLDDGEFKGLLGALGIALGIAYLLQRNSGGLGGG